LSLVLDLTDEDGKEAAMAESVLVRWRWVFILWGWSNATLI